MDSYAITRRSSRRSAGVLAAATAALLLLGTGGAALAQQDGSSENSPAVTEQLQRYARELANRDRDAAERQAQLRTQLKQLEYENVNLQSQLADVQQQYQGLQQELARVASERAESAVRVFRLRHARAEAVAEMLKQVHGDRLRMAVGQPSNTLIVSSAPDVLAATEQLVNTLDTPPEGPPTGPEAERTLQLRILWLADISRSDVGTEPDERYVSPMVVDTLHGLGLAHPRIVCQHATTLSTRHEGRSEFSLRDPVKIGDVPAYMQGRGLLSAVEGDRFRIELNIGIETESRKDSNGVIVRDGRRICDMTGSLVMPLEHYVVLGTTNYVEQKDDGSSGESLPTAFVVFLQEAPIAPR